MASKYLSLLSQADYESLKKKLLSIQNDTCYICNEKIDSSIHTTNVDHIVPLSLKGKDNEENFALTHESCNKSKLDSNLNIARKLHILKNIQDAIRKNEGKSASLKHVLEKYKGSKYEFSYKENGKEIKYSFSKNGDNNIYKAPIFIDDLLLIAKMNRSSLENISREWEIDELVNEVIKTTELTRIMKGITIHKTGISFKCIGIDRTLILQILFNLVSNAIKFSYPHSSVHIFIERVDEAYCVHVIDKGVGIPDEEEDNVFLEWHKAMPFGTTGEEGNGVGLAMCKNLVQSFGGTIGLKSEYQSGSDFYFTIPD